MAKTIRRVMFCLLVAGCSGSALQTEETGVAASAVAATCNPGTENCCPSGFTEKVLTTASDAFSAAQANLCVRALSGNDTVMVGPGAYVIGGPGNDTINAYNHATVIPGPGADIVSISTGGTIKIFDLCEIASGENLYGGGDGTLVTPVSLGVLQESGVVVSGFSQVLIEAHSCQSSCVTKPSCGHGKCTEKFGMPGQMFCQCNADFTGPNCATFLDKDHDTIGDSLDPCPNGPADNGAPCSDGDQCTILDSCQNNLCQPGPLGTVADLRCSTLRAGPCDPAIGLIADPFPDGTFCSFVAGVPTTGICESGRCVPHEPLTMDTGHRASDPALTLLRRDNAFARGIDHTRTVVFNGQSFPEQVQSNAPSSWGFTNFDLSVQVTGNDALGSRTTNPAGLSCLPGFTGHLGTDFDFDFIARGLQAGYGESVIGTIHHEISAFFPPIIPERVMLDPLTMLVPVQIVKVLPPSSSSVFAALNGIGVRQRNNLFDNIPVLNRSVTSHPNGEAFANVNYEIQPMPFQFADADLIWAQCGIQFRAVSCGGTPEAPGVETCPDLNVTQPLDFSAQGTQCHITPAQRVQIPAQCGCEDIILSHNLQDARMLPGVRQDLPLLLLTATVGDDTCQTCTASGCGSVADKANPNVIFLSSFNQSSSERFALAHEIGHMLGIARHIDTVPNLMASFVSQQTSFIPQEICQIARDNAAQLVKRKWGVTVDSTRWTVTLPPAGL